MAERRLMIISGTNYRFGQLRLCLSKYSGWHPLNYSCFGFLLIISSEQQGSSVVILPHHSVTDQLTLTSLSPENVHLALTQRSACEQETSSIYNRISLEYTNTVYLKGMDWAPKALVPFFLFSLI